MSPAHKKTKQAYHHGALKQGLVEAAAQLIKKNGHIGFNLRELAKACSVSAPAVYRHFSSKNTLMVAIADAGFKNILSKFKNELPPKDSVSTKERLIRLGEIYIDFAVKNEGEFRVMFSRELRQISEYKLIAPLAEESFSFLKELICDILPLHDSKADQDNQVIGSWAIVHGLANLRIDGNLKDLSIEKFNTMVRSVLSFG